MVWVAILTLVVFLAGLRIAAGKAIHHANKN